MRLHSPRESYLWLKALWDHRRTQRLSRTQLEAEQRAKFRRLVSFIYQHSPYYRALIKTHGLDPLTCLPTDFPILTKSDVIEHFNEIITDRTITRRDIAEFLSRSRDPEELFRGRYHVLHTSGTSGTVGYYLFSHKAWIKGASNPIRVSSLRLRRKVAYIAATRGHFAGVSLVLAGNDGTNRLFHNVRTFDVGQPLSQIIRELNQFQPEAISGYATILRQLAEAQERGELRISPTHIGNGGEALLPEVKAYLERVFRVPALNSYASSEHLVMGLNLPGTDGLHLLEDDLIFELRPDCTCITNLFNEVLPLIRYRMDDVLIPDTSNHSPYPYTKVQEVIGRREHSLAFTNEHGQEDFIHPIVIVELIIPGLKAWQVVLESKTRFRFRACFNSNLTKQEHQETQKHLCAKLDAILAEKEMRNVAFTLEPVDSLPIDAATGKFRLVLRA
ncbi:MAG: phenylacetate--CoA ligase family protein [Verrucomicrobia bacterium]|nr:phenylacetate--CoA ligase family protein [Verrucomicrobiota bacterium]